MLLKGAPSILAPNRLNIDIFEIVRGYTTILDKIQIDRDVQGIITVTSTGRLFKDTLRLAPESEFIEEELDFLCIKQVEDEDIVNPDDI